jgi:hypothetical protein
MREMFVALVTNFIGVVMYELIHVDLNDVVTL